MSEDELTRGAAERGAVAAKRKGPRPSPELDAAAALLVEIAGPEPVHIEMSAAGPKKYYAVHRAITAQDTRAHLLGRTTRGATLRHPGGMTRALCYDADTPGDWLRLIEAAWVLSEGGYCPLLEASSAQDDNHAGGGHLWIIYSALVKAIRAQRHLTQLAPMLEHLTESWPGASGKHVRLPGGLYVRPGVRAWCKLYDAQGRLLSADGPGTAAVLLEWQTLAQLVPAFPEATRERKSSELAALPNTGVGQRTASTSLPTQHEQEATGNERRMEQGEAWGDERWQQKYGRSLWFQFTPGMLAAWYNERNLVQEILPPEKNGMGLASWRGERTASVGLRESGWVDFGASARRAGGRQDGGDALELAVRVRGEAKAEVMRKVARQLVREAREAMEYAARAGEKPPAWVTEIMTEAGWHHYHSLCAEAAGAGASTTAGG